MIKNYMRMIFTIILIGLTCIGCNVNSTETDMQSEKENIGLAGTVKMQSADSLEYIKIYSCFLEGEEIYATIEVKVPQEVTKNNFEDLFEIVSEAGKTCEYSIEDFIQQGEKQLVVIKFLNEVTPSIPERYDLIYKGNALPIVFSKLAEGDPQATIKNLDKENDVTIAAFPYYNDEQVATVTVEVIDSDGKIVTENISNAMVSVHDYEGEIYNVEVTGNTIKIKDAMFSDGLIMEITELPLDDQIAENKVVWEISLKY